MATGAIFELILKIIFDRLDKHEKLKWVGIGKFNCNKHRLRKR